MTLPRRAAALAALVATTLAVPAAAPAAAEEAGPAPAVAGQLADVLPEDVVEDLPARAAADVAEVLTAPGEGALVAVAVEDEDGGLAVERLTVDEADAADVADLLQDLPSVEAASVATTVRATGQVATATSAPEPVTAAATDPRRRDQWGLDALGAEQLRAAAAPQAPVVAVLDTGVDGTHEDLQGVVLQGTDLVGAGNGWADQNGHGTHVAGTAAALVGNGLGGQGVLGRVQVLPVRVLDHTGAGYTSDIAEGVLYAADRGADVINLSLGGPGNDRVLAAAIRDAVSRGVVVVAAMGNDGLAGSPTSYPAALPDVVAVTALTRSLARAPYSSQGAHADLAAPGSDVVSTVPGSRYGSASGTSMATPHVAAVAAALAAAVPAASAAEISDALTSTADDLAPVGRDGATGQGLVDPDEALALLRASTGVLPAAPQRPQVVSSDRRALVAWGAPSTTPGGRPTGYEVEVRGDGQPLQRGVLGAGASSWTATGLVNGLGYVVRVRATSAAGAGPWAPAVIARPATKPSAPRGPVVGDGDRSGVVSWSPPASHGGSMITGYEVLVRGSGQPDQRLRTTSRSVSVRGLVNGLGYQVHVRAVNAQGLGPSAYVVARPRTLASAPRSVSAAGGSTTDRAQTVVFRWAPPSSDGGAVVTGYRVVVRENGTTRDVALSAPAGATSLTAGGLRRGAGYTAVVRAVNAAGVGPASARTPSATAR